MTTDELLAENLRLKQDVAFLRGELTGLQLQADAWGEERERLTKRLEEAKVLLITVVVESSSAWAVRRDAFLAPRIPVDASAPQHPPAPPDNNGLLEPVWEKLDKLTDRLRDEVITRSAVETDVQRLEQRVVALEDHRHCRNCGAILQRANVVMADGCHCNSDRGVNHGIVARDVCTCSVCDPCQTGASRRRSGALPAPVASPRERMVCGPFQCGCGRCRLRKDGTYIKPVAAEAHAFVPVGEGPSFEKLCAVCFDLESYPIHATPKDGAR